jgi:glutamate synthase (ferredoxin)
VILGNTCLYGATGGELFALGRAGERFGVRNSGAYAVVEGAGDHCCEYMTGGVIVVLGGTGRNVGAGMTGGVAFLLDETGGVRPRVNAEIVEVVSITTPQQESLLRSLLEMHVSTTASTKAKALLSDWTNSMSAFKVLVPPSERAAMGLFERTAVTA